MDSKSAIANNYDSATKALEVASKALANENEANDKANYNALEAYNNSVNNYKHAFENLTKYYNAKTDYEENTKYGRYDNANKANIIITESHALFNEHYKVGNTSYEVGNKAIGNFVASNATKRARTLADAYFNAYNTLKMSI